MTQIFSSKRKYIARRFYEFMLRTKALVHLVKRGERYYVIQNGYGG